MMKKQLKEDDILAALLKVKPTTDMPSSKGKRKILKPKSKSMKRK